jgi:hypothetical protein
MFELNGQSELFLLNNHQTPPAEKETENFPVETRGIHCNKICINRIICTLPFRIRVFHQHNLEFLIKFLGWKNGKFTFFASKTLYRKIY